MLLLRKNMPRWIIFFIDIFICIFSLTLAYQLRFNFNVPENEMIWYPVAFSSLIIVRTLSMLVSRTYKGIIRYTSYKDSQRIFLTLFAGTFILAIANYAAFYIYGRYLIPFSILIIDFIASVLFMTSSRITVKMAYMEMINSGRHKIKVIIYGAGEGGLLAKQAMERDAGTNYNIVAFVDDNKKLRGRKIEGTEVYHADTDLEDLLRANEISNLIIAAQDLTHDRINHLFEICLGFNTRVLLVPPVKNWINGRLSFGQIKNINIEDLLEREPIVLDADDIRKEVEDKTVLISGAAGSIGSEIVRQLLNFKPKKLLLLDIAESPLYELELELTDQLATCEIESIVADIRNRERMLRVFDYCMPELVFHAAAYKHVPIMENNPSEAILTNISGTRTIADLSVEFAVKKFVMVSTDKAVNPTNVMGATKRIAEIYCQALNEQSKTKFITTRFGNVLGSVGSVIPRFKKQIENRQPVTVTHPEITRFFMTIPEACQLVLEACAMGKGGEIFIFDMGKPVRIADLARKMIKLSGLEPDVDIKIVYTGLRPGEKLYEELLSTEENTMPTHHKKIMIAKVRTYNFREISEKIDELISLFKSQDNFSIVAKMKEIVPEYISSNSEFEKLDIVK